MSAPATPTSTTIVTEAFNKFGIATPSSAQLLRGINYILEAVKDDIWEQSKKWRSLQTYDFLPTISGTPHYQAPTDYESSLEIVLLDGTSRSTLAAASAGSLTLNASEASSQGDTEGKLIFISAGTGINQAKYCRSYNASSKVATLSENYSVLPVIGDSYLIVTQNYNLGSPEMIERYDALISPGISGRPEKCYHVPDTAEGDFFLYPVPDKVYGLMRRYYSNLKKLDLASTLYTRILWQWRDVWTLGCFYYLCEDYGDKRAERAEKRYIAALLQLKAREVDGVDSSNLQRTATD